MLRSIMMFCLILMHICTLHFGIKIYKNGTVCILLYAWKYGDATG